MNKGFPLRLLTVLRCLACGRGLEAHGERRLSADGASIERGRLICPDCGAFYPIDEGIVRMVDAGSLDRESRHEQTIRDERAKVSPRQFGPEHQDESDRMEMIPTWESLAPERGMSILELGCGGGRYTVELAERFESVVAVDFSVDSLVKLQTQVQDGRNVGLVHGDVTTLRLAPGFFDRALSTLVSNLPTQAHRDAMNRLAASALKPDGRFVFNAHHHGVRQIMAREPKSGYYEKGGIYRYELSVSECAAEVRRHFAEVKVTPISIRFPLARSLGLPALRLSRWLEPIPMVNKLADMLLCDARRPKVEAAS